MQSVRMLNPKWSELVYLADHPIYHETTDPLYSLYPVWTFGQRSERRPERRAGQCIAIRLYLRPPLRYYPTPFPGRRQRVFHDSQPRHDRRHQLAARYHDPE